jgi:hypothetical protein
MKFLLLPRIIESRDFHSLPNKNLKFEIANISDHYAGLIKALSLKNHEIKILLGDSIFIGFRTELVGNFFTKLILKILRNLPGLRQLDVFFYSVFIGFYCKYFKIDVVYCELERKFNPSISKKISKKTSFHEWVGVHPHFLGKSTMNNIKNFDVIWSLGLYKKSVNVPNRQAWRYIGNVVDPDAFERKPVAKDIDILFCGGVTAKHSERIKFLEMVSKEFANFHFYGYGLEYIPSESPLRLCFKGWKSPAEIPDLIAKSRIILNLTMDDYDILEKGYNSRLLEVACTGTSVQILKLDDKISEFLDINKSVVTFTDQFDFVHKAREVLQNYESYRNMILHAKKEAAIFNYDRFTNMILEELQLKNGEK